MNSLICNKVLRRENVRRDKLLNGLDYLEVGQIEQLESSLQSQRVLTVYFLGKAPVKLNEKNILIEGGQRIRDIQVLTVDLFRSESVEFDDSMTVVVDQPGDFSTYVLRVVENNEQGEWQTHAQFDPRYDRIEFSFKVDCPNELDCKQEAVCPPEKLEQPDINYLAKDYTSFRQLILDRLALVMPDWQERHVPDVGIALVEVFAYVGDHLSYYQDAVATEAYLDTARKRISVRRHARLVDYNMHEGCNARAWVCVHTDSESLSFDPNNVYFITGFNEALQTVGDVLTEEDIRQIPSSLYEVFEPIGHEHIKIYHDHSKINFYSWGDKECCLPKGSTRATLVGRLVSEIPMESPPCDAIASSEIGVISTGYVSRPKQPKKVVQSDLPELHLKAGDVLIFEEIIGPETHHSGDADPKHRQAVRLTEVQPNIDQLNGQSVVEIAWSQEDALTFPLCLSSLGPPPACEIRVVSIACGNVILADHGRTVDEDIGKVPEGETIECCKAEGVLADKVLIPRFYRPSLKYAPLTFSQPLVSEKPASSTLKQDVRQALPRIELISIPSAPDNKEALLSWDEIENPEKLAKRLKTVSRTNSHTLRQMLSAKSLDLLEKHDLSTPLPTELKRALIELIDSLTIDWEPKQGLLGSGPDDQHFVAEMDNDGRAHLRFGDDESGEKPDAGITFQANYRIGNGLAGNVGAEAISFLVLRNTQSSGTYVSVRNPLPAQGGKAAEPMAEVKLYAPHTFRKELQRAITADDYASIVQREFKDKVHRAAARLRWTGSWYEVLVAIDPFGQEQANAELLDAIFKRLHRYRRMGHDLVVKSARRVPLDIEILVCVLPNYLRGHIKAALLGLFSNRILPDGRLGFFYPDNLTFGEGIYLSKLVAVAQAVEGVESVQVIKLQRQNETPNQEIENGVLLLGPFEIARLDNNPSFPENGILKLDVRGGR